MSKKTIFTILILSIFSFLTLGLTFSLPAVDVPETSVVYDINGKAIKGLAEQNSISVDLDDVSKYFLMAVVAVEDKSFYQHHGIDIMGIARAALINLKSGKIVEGGSTITQQTAKNLFLSNERTFTRKIKEVFYAIQLERKYSKDEILQMYINSIYFGNGAYGVEVASRTFFAKEAKDLDLAESALLAGLPQWPSNYNPYENPDAAKNRQLIVLSRMEAEGYISAAEKEKAAAAELKYQKSLLASGEAPYFIAMVKEYLTEKYGERMVYQGGLRIFTTLDLTMQQAANRAVTDRMKARDPNLQVALIALDNSNGQIRALVGGRNFASSGYNRVYAYRQPGSTFKPFMYSLAIDSGYTAADRFMCEEKEYHLPDGQVYKPSDHGKNPYHQKKFTLKEAVMISDNVIAVQLNSVLGPENTAAYAQNFGFSNIKPVLSLPLGSNEVRPIDLAAGYAVFANQGIYNKPMYIIKVTDKKGRILEENTAVSRRVTSADTAYIITNILNGVLQPGGTASHLKDMVGKTAAAKTGTTDEYKDAWFAGYTKNISCVVWVGYDKDENANLAGGVAAGPVWAQFMGEAVRNLYADDFEKPANIENINICLDTGLIASESCPRTSLMAFKKGTEPQEICWQHKYKFWWDLLFWEDSEEEDADHSD